MTDPFLNFWAKSFGLSPVEMLAPEARVVTSGKYVERYGDEYIYLFKDLSSGKMVLAGTKLNMESLELNQPFSNMDFSRFNKAYEDIDYLLPEKESFQAVKSAREIRRLDPKDKEDVLDFQNRLSEDDRDTLDLTFEGETLFGVIEDQKVIGISRFVSLRDEPKIADITIVLDEKFRGQGYGVELASQLVEEILKEGLYPRYRVNRELGASISIARRLGFQPRYEVTTFSREFSF